MKSRKRRTIGKLLKARGEVEYDMLTCGKLDQWIGEKVMLPIIKRLAFLADSRRLCRVFLSVGALIGLSYGAMMLAAGDWVGFIICGVWIPWPRYIIRHEVRPFEREYERCINSDTLSYALFRRVSSIATQRMMWIAVLASGMVVLFLGGLSVVIWASQGPLVVLGFYCATCVAPKRKIKSLAKAKNWWQRAVAPRPVPVPVAVGV